MTEYENMSVDEKRRFLDEYRKTHKPIVLKIHESAELPIWYKEKHNLK